MKNISTIALYNVENLFDTINNPLTADDDYTPKGRLNWSKKRYFRKIKKISSVIAQLGTDFSKHPPVIIGLVEVENKNVVEDLINHKYLQPFHYNYVHHESPDERGIDVALIYQKTAFEFTHSKIYSLDLFDKEGKRDYTRDILLVTGKLKGELIHIFVNHWPSRREGVEITEPNRIKAAKVVHNAILEIKSKTSDPKIIIMGDFNDDPVNISVKQYLVTDDLYNPMESLFQKGLGTTTFNKKWNLFDQIIISKNFLSKTPNHTFLYANIFNKKWLKFYQGKRKGSPFRTYIGRWYKGGFSDHFPVYICLENKRSEVI